MSAVQLPPAASIAALALALNLCAVTESFFFNSPAASIFTCTLPLPLARPLAMTAYTSTVAPSSKFASKSERFTGRYSVR